MIPTIGCRKLRVTARGHELLYVDQLEVLAGQTLGVLGPNGAGKSTLLRALALLIPHPWSGQVLLDGRPATEPAMRTAVAGILQRPILRRGTVAANVAGGLRLRGVGRREAQRRAAPWLDALQITHLAERDARSLSGGEAQRVSIARALAVQPRVLLLDEPFTGLDATTRADLIADLRAVLNQLGAATILVTHDRHEAIALAERTALLLDGRIRQYGRTREVLDNPVDYDCARLLGYTNLLPPDTTGLGHHLVARPEHCQPIGRPDAAPPGALVVSATLRRVVPLGGATRFDLDTDSGTLACLTTVDLPGTALGGRTWVAITEARGIGVGAPTLVSGPGSARAPGSGAAAYPRLPIHQTGL
jgi:ABC-type sulfate/molybdate transport systems ATPase subunit